MDISYVFPYPDSGLNCDLKVPFSTLVKKFRLPNLFLLELFSKIPKIFLIFLAFDLCFFLIYKMGNVILKFHKEVLLELIFVLFEDLSTVRRNCPNISSSY